MSRKSSKAPKIEPFILYEDNHLVVLYKPAGMPSVPDSSGDKSALVWAKAYIKHTRNKPGNVFLGVVHRLDRPVSGVLCFATTSKGAKRLSAQLRNRTMKKIYLAVVRGRPEKESEILIHFIEKDHRRNKVVVRPALNGQRGRISETRFEILASTGRASLLRVIPITGRPHQIRAQLASIGCAILGDLKYGADTPLPNRSIALHAQTLELRHPTKPMLLRFNCPPPKTAPWNAFSSFFPHAPNVLAHEVNMMDNSL